MFEGGALGNYSLAGFEMVLVRHVMHYIINYYLPSGLFVVVSWISFLVPAEVLPGKKSESPPCPHGRGGPELVLGFCFSEDAKRNPKCDSKRLHWQPMSQR